MGEGGEKAGDKPKNSGPVDAASRACKGSRWDQSGRASAVSPPVDHVALPPYLSIRLRVRLLTLLVALKHSSGLAAAAARTVAAAATRAVAGPLDTPPLSAALSRCSTHGMLYVEGTCVSRAHACVRYGAWAGYGAHSVAPTTALSASLRQPPLPP